MAALHDALGHDGEVLAALLLGAAIPANLLGGVVLQGTAIRANGAIRPAGGFKPLTGGFLVVKVGFCELVLGHLFAPMARILALAACGVNYVIMNYIPHKRRDRKRGGQVVDLPSCVPLGF